MAMQPGRNLSIYAHEWSLLQPEALAALTQHQLRLGGTQQLAAAAAAQRPELDPLVRRFRKLREGLTSCGCQDTWAVQVYELSADVCALAENTAELLKCLQALVNTLYPAMEDAQAHRVHQQRPGSTGSSQLTELPTVFHSSRGLQTPAAADESGVSTSRAPQGPGILKGAADPWGDADDAHISSGCGATAGSSFPADRGGENKPTNSGGSAASALAPHPPAAAGPTAAPPPAARGPLGRQGEVQGALLLWFLCIPVRPVHAEVAKRLRAMPPHLLDTPEAQLALRAASAIMRGNWVQLHACTRAAPPLVARVLHAGAAPARGRAARAMAVAYRALPVAVFCAALGVHASSGGSGGESPVGSDVCDEHSVLVIQQALQHAKETLGCRGAAIALEQLAATQQQQLVPTEVKFR